MSAFNVENTIAESIESVLNQSFTDFELLIVDSGSTDNTRAAAGSFNDKRIRLIDNAGDYIQSLNAGIKDSTGKYIARMDAGDIMHVDRLKLQFSIMEEFPEITICSSWETVFGEKMASTISMHKLLGFVELPLVQLLLDDVRVNPAYTFRKSFIDEYDLLYENYTYSEDYKLWAEILKLNGCLYIDSQPLAYRRMSDAKISSNRKIKQMRSISKIKKEIMYFLCNKYLETHPALITLHNSYYELLEQNLVSENDIIKLFHTIFTKNKDTFKR